MTAGIALSKDERYKGFNKYTRTTRILRMWQYNQKFAKRKSIVSKVAKKTHSSSKTVLQDTLPYLRVIFKNNTIEAEKLANYFELDNAESAYLKV